MTDKLIWGLDTATKVTGWAVGTGEVRPTCDVFRYPQVGSDLGAMARSFIRDLDALAERFGPPDVIAYESPLLTPGDKLLTLRKLYGLGMIVEWWGDRVGAKVVEVSNGQIKKRIAGNFRAKKPELVRVVRERLGVYLPAGEVERDAADAFGAWLAGGVDHYAKHYQARWDQQIMTGRGSLL